VTRRIEREDRRLRASGAGILEAAMDDEHGAVGPGLGADDGAPLHSRRQSRPIRVATVGIGQIVDGLRALPLRLAWRLSGAGQRKHRHNQRAGDGFMTTCDVRNDGAKQPVVVEIRDTYQADSRVIAERDDI
jgi:hypothetical protein